MKKKLDKRDINILTELYKNSRIPISQISKKIKIPNETIKYRIDQLEKNQIINKYYVVTDISKLGLNCYQLYLKIKGISSAEEKIFLKEVLEIKNLSWFVKTSGKFSYIMVFLAKSHLDFMKSHFKIREILGENIILFHVNLPVIAKQYSYSLFAEDSIIKPLKVASGASSSILLDDINSNIMSLLSKNCRLSLSEIAQTIGCNIKTVKERIKWLESKEVIISYSINLNLNDLGYFFNLFLIKLAYYDESIINFLESFTEVHYIVTGAGFFELQVEIITNDSKKLYEIEESLYENFKSIVLEIDILLIMEEYEVSYYI